MSFYHFCSKIHFVLIYAFEFDSRLFQSKMNIIYYYMRHGLNEGINHRKTYINCQVQIHKKELQFCGQLGTKGFFFNFASSTILFLRVLIFFIYILKQMFSLFKSLYWNSTTLTTLTPFLPLQSLTSEATPLATHVFKRSYKISHPP